MAAFDPERAKVYFDAVKEHGSQREAARVLNVNQSTISNSLRAAAMRGLLPLDPVMPGFQIKRVSETQDGAGNVKARSIVQTHAPGEKFKLPKGHQIKGVSALVDADGSTVQQWVKTSREPLSFERMAELAEHALSDFKPVAPAVITPDCDSDRLAVYPWADWHLGLLAWGRETDGADWDLSIARKVITSTFREVVESTPATHTAVLLGLGDLLHIDSHKSQTPESGNLLDSDSRYDKIFEAAIEVLIECTEIAREKHRDIELHLVRGNHDPSSTVGLRQVLKMYYREQPSVHVGNSPSPFFVKRFGKNLIGAVHGDKAKREELPIIMATRWPGEWADVTTRHWHTGHIHHDTLKEINGVSVYSHRAPVAQDAYHAANGYLAGRSMKGYVYHITKGYRSSTEVGI